MTKKEIKALSGDTLAAYNNLSELVAIVADEDAKVQELDARVNETLRLEVDDVRAEITESQANIKQAEEAAEVICAKNRKWFGGKQSLNLPHGTCTFRESTSLNVPSEPTSITLVRAVLGPDADKYVRTVETLDLEALEKLDDATLTKLGITRVKKETFSVKPRKVDLGKVVAGLAKDEEKKEAA